MIYTIVFRDSKGKTVSLSFRNLNRISAEDFKEEWLRCLNHGSEKICGRYVYDWTTVLDSMKASGFAFQEDSCFALMNDKIAPKEMRKLEETIVGRSKVGIRL